MKPRRPKETGGGEPQPEPLPMDVCDAVADYRARQDAAEGRESVVRYSLERQASLARRGKR
jgi:hypothetical protein